MFYVSSKITIDIIIEIFAEYTEFLKLGDPVLVFKFFNGENKSINPDNMRADQRNYLRALVKKNPDICEYEISQKFMAFSVRFFGNKRVYDLIKIRDEVRDCKLKHKPLPTYPRDFNDNQSKYNHLIPRYMQCYKDAIVGLNLLSVKYKTYGNIKVNGFPKKYDIRKNRCAQIGTTLKQYLETMDDVAIDEELERHSLYEEKREIPWKIDWQRLSQWNEDIEFEIKLLKEEIQGLYNTIVI